jgi:hypothetical protein
MGLVFVVSETISASTITSIPDDGGRDIFRNDGKKHHTRLCINEELACRKIINCKVIVCIRKRQYTVKPGVKR